LSSTSGRSGDEVEGSRVEALSISIAKAQAQALQKLNQQMHMATWLPAMKIEYV
jgi:hypothetical protein